MKPFFLLIFIALILFLAIKSNAQTGDKERLFNEIKRMDSLLFKAVNTCDTVAYKNYFTKDLEFYHDKAGVSYYDDEVASIINRCKAGIQIRRILIPTTLKVFPIKDYGAIEEAEHTFYFTEPGKQEQFAGTFKFIHIWRLENKSWKISRVISYGH